MYCIVERQLNAHLDELDAFEALAEHAEQDEFSQYLDHAKELAWEGGRPSWLPFLEWIEVLAQECAARDNYALYL